MEEQQQLGGARRATPLKDEETYPLTSDEFLHIKENLVNNRFTPWQALLISTFLTTLVSGIVFSATVEAYSNITVDKKIIQQLNPSYIIILVIYFGLSFGALIALIVYEMNKKKSRTSIDRLNKKIEDHLKVNVKDDE